MPEVIMIPETERIHLNIKKIDDEHVNVQFMWLDHNGKMINNQLQYPIQSKFSVVFNKPDQIDQVIRYLDACKRILSGELNNESFSTQIIP